MPQAFTMPEMPYSLTFATSSLLGENMLCSLAVPQSPQTSRHTSRLALCDAPEIYPTFGATCKCALISESHDKVPLLLSFCTETNPHPLPC